MSNGTWEISMKKLGGQRSGCTIIKLLPINPLFTETTPQTYTVLSAFDCNVILSFHFICICQCLLKTLSLSSLNISVNWISVLLHISKHLPMEHEPSFHSWFLCKCDVSLHLPRPDCYSPCCPCRLLTTPSSACIHYKVFPSTLESFKTTFCFVNNLSSWLWRRGRGGRGEPRLAALKHFSSLCPSLFLSN